MAIDMYIPSLWDDSRPVYPEDFTKWEQEFKTIVDELKRHMATRNDHNLTKVDLGLGNVNNFGIASIEEAQIGTNLQKYMTPKLTAEAIGKLQAIKSINGRTGDISLSKVDVQLGNVENYSVASRAEALAGVATDKLMTPANVLATIKEQFKTQEILYEGSAYPGSSTYTFKNAQTISEQNLGIIIVWSDFDKSGSGGTANNYNFDFTFIPKWFISKHAGTNVNVPVATNINTSTAFVTVKTLYITDTSIRGSDLNSTGMYADDVVMRYVIGV
ncbi:hypothetical protein HCJ02_01690 [Listeria seeligeri]|uniref:hypothetical protein n=1 Tax=Listeria TaxID=1637 RepID=UPI001629BD4E|nr:MULTISPECIES: hypothetical protein [Listeria]MBC1532045.1 hypothetical protein [Listeria seeligeri]MBC1827142.1 hypothetical protein [Listeria seeligeri]MBC1840066.1 hypothetical protein [Listeria seeligeri]MBC6141930.1 hypothetical protein [Listeria seeligeri]MBC6302447.1 hypothetical protein [Listeria immobilis]